MDHFLEYILRMPDSPVQDVPRFFRRCVASPRIRNYFIAGYYLAVQARFIVALERGGTVEGFNVAVMDGPTQVVDWMQGALPDCMELVPMSGLGTFTDGVEQAMNEGVI